MKKIIGFLLMVLCCFQMTAFAEEPFIDDIISETEAADSELTEQQQAVILEMAEPYLDYVLYRPSEWLPEGKTSITNAELTMEDVLDRLYDMLHSAWYYGSVIVTPVEHENTGSFGFYPEWYDKESALKNWGDLYGCTITDNDIAEYNASFGYDTEDRIAIDGGCISFMGADGETDYEIPSIDEYTVDGDILTVSIPFIRANYNDDEISYDHVTAVYTANPGSFIGYTFESITLD